MVWVRRHRSLLSLGTAMKHSRQPTVVLLLVVGLTASAQLFQAKRLVPKDISDDPHFAFTVSSTNTGPSVNFAITVAPKTSEPLFYNARVMCFDGECEISQMRLEYPHKRGEPSEYRFGLATNLLAYSQFILRYSTMEDIAEREAVDSIWFFLKDFAPGPTPNQGGAANRSQPADSKTNRTSSAAGSRR